MINFFKKLFRKNIDKKNDKIEELIPDGLNRTERENSKYIITSLEHLYVHFENDIVRKSLDTYKIKCDNISYFERAYFCNFLIKKTLERMIEKRMPEYLNTCLNSWLTIYFQEKLREHMKENGFNDITEFFEQRYILYCNFMDSLPFYKSTNDERFNKQNQIAEDKVKWFWFKSPLSKTHYPTINIEENFCFDQIIFGTRNQLVDTLEEVLTPIVKKIK